MLHQKHPIWFLLFLVIVGGLGLGYCSLMYRNGAEPLKDGGLMAIVAALMGAWFKFSGISDSGSGDK